MNTGDTYRQVRRRCRCYEKTLAVRTSWPLLPIESALSHRLYQVVVQHDAAFAISCATEQQRRKYHLQETFVTGGGIRNPPTQQQSSMSVQMHASTSAFKRTTGSMHPMPTMLLPTAATRRQCTLTAFKSYSTLCSHTSTWQCVSQNETHVSTTTLATVARNAISGDRSQSLCSFSSRA